MLASVFRKYNILQSGYMFASFRNIYWNTRASRAFSALILPTTIVRVTT